jgi:hypothetical protein
MLCDGRDIAAVLKKERSLLRKQTPRKIKMASKYPEKRLPEPGYFSEKEKSGRVRSSAKA